MPITTPWVTCSTISHVTFKFLSHIFITQFRAPFATLWINFSHFSQQNFVNVVAFLVELAVESKLKHCPYTHFFVSVLIPEGEYWSGPEQAISISYGFEGTISCSLSVCWKKSLRDRIKLEFTPAIIYFFIKFQRRKLNGVADLS